MSETLSENMVVPGNITTTNNASTMTNFSNYRIFNTNQDGGHVLPVMLEPLAEYALIRYKNILGLDVIANTNYSILRLINKLV